MKSGRHGDRDYHDRTRVRLEPARPCTCRISPRIEEPMIAVTQCRRTCQAWATIGGTAVHHLTGMTEGARRYPNRNSNSICTSDGHPDTVQLPCQPKLPGYNCRHTRGKSSQRLALSTRRATGGEGRLLVIQEFLDRESGNRGNGLERTSVVSYTHLEPGPAPATCQ